MKRTVFFIVFLLSFYCKAQNILRDGHKVEVNLEQDVSSKDKQPIISVAIADDIYLGGEIIISKGTPVEIKSKLIEPAKKKSPGRIDIRVASTKTIYGETILLRSGIYKEGDGKTISFGAFGFTTGFSAKKNNVVISKNEIFSVYVANDYPIHNKTTETVQSQNQDTDIDKQAELLALTLQKLQTSANNTLNNTPANAQSQPLSNQKLILSDVDENIPVTNTKKTDTYVLIIANENYMFVDKVPFAQNDGEAFKEYCIKTLGIPEKQVRLCANASAGVLAGGIDWLMYALNNFEDSKAIVYYCGHGIPDEKTGDAYIIPTDGKGTNTSTCYSLNTLYKTLAATKAAQVTYFMDACFTGANKEGSMLVAARGIAREAKKETLQGNSIVFSAASGDETAMSYPEKQHGLFTYFLLKKLQETKGDVNYGDLAKYINDNVKKEAFLTNEKPQNPVVATSPSAEQTWRTMRLK